MNLDFSNIYIMVIGESCIDEFIYLENIGKSPEASGPKTKIISKSEKKGMAYNVSLNLSDLYCNYVLYSNQSAIIRKTRYYIDGKYQFRIDQDGRVLDSDGHAITSSKDVEDYFEQEFHLNLEDQEDKKHCGIIISDYGKGFVTRELIQVCIDTGLPVLIDPHPTQPLDKYKGCTFICPNKEESKILTGYNDIISSSYKFLKATGCKGVLNKLSENGLAYIGDDKVNYHFPALCKNPVDVCGAGDTTVAAFFASWLSNNTIHDSIKIASCAAKLVVQKPETATAPLKELQEEIKSYFHNIMEEALK